MWQDTETHQEAAERRKTAAQQHDGSFCSRERQGQHFPTWLMTGLQRVTRWLLKARITFMFSLRKCFSHLITVHMNKNSSSLTDWLWSCCQACTASRRYAAATQIFDNCMMYLYHCGERQGKRKGSLKFDFLELSTSNSVDAGRLSHALSMGLPTPSPRTWG